jgi:hypothetical protein
MSALDRWMRGDIAGVGKAADLGGRVSCSGGNTTDLSLSLIPEPASEARVGDSPTAPARLQQVSVSALWLRAPAASEERPEAEL